MKHYLKKGERLESLSARYRVPVCMIVRANNVIKEQSEIEIPKLCYCSMCAQKQQRRFEMYTVGSESAETIAQKYSISVKQLTELNAMRSRDEICPGTVICVPTENK